MPISRRSRFRRRLKRWALIVLALGMVAVIVALVVRRVAQHRIAEQTKIAVPPGIDQLEKIDLGGVEQWILIRGHQADAEVLLFVHGGPGVPNMPFCHLNAALERKFVVVQWDQRGAGKSFASDVPPDSMRIDQFVSDARELSELLAARFDKEKIYLLGHSWGSVIGAKAASRFPELYHAYIGVSQVTNVMETQEILYRETLDAAKAASNEKAVSELERIGSPPFAKPDDHLIACRWLAEFQRRPFVEKRKLLAELVSSPHYTLADLNRFRRGMGYSLDHLWEPLGEVDLFQEIPSLKMPVTYIQGRDDPLIPGELIERYVRALDAPKGKRLVMVDEAGHMPHFENPRAFERAVVEVLELPED